MRILIFSATVLRNISHSEKNSPSYYQLCTTKIKRPEGPEPEVTSRTATFIIRVVHSFPIFVHSCLFPAFHSLRSFTPRMY